MSLRIEYLPYDGVTAQDISLAENFGVIDGLKRHLDKPIDHIARAALEIMETLYKRGYNAKVSMFVYHFGKDLYHQLPSLVAKAEFAMRVCKIVDKRLKPTWGKESCRLLANTAVRGECSKAAIRTFASVFAEMGSVEESLHYLQLGEAGREHFNDAALTFFKRGDFKNGLCLLNHSPMPILDRKFDNYTSCDFTELLGYALQHREILPDSKYQKALIATLSDTSREYIILNALCFLGYLEQAKSYAKTMTLRMKSIYPMISVYKHLPVDSLERKTYFEQTVHVAVNLEMQENEKCTGYHALASLAKHKNLTHNEASLVCYSMTLHSARLESLWERTCGILIQWEKNAEDLRQLQILLSSMRTHASNMSFSDWGGHWPFWVKIISEQILYGFLDEALTTCQAWHNWIACRGPDKNGDTFNEDDIWFLSYAAPLYFMIGNTEEGKKAVDLAYITQKVLWKRYPNCNSFDYLFRSGLNTILRSPLAVDYDTSNRLKDLEEYRAHFRNQLVKYVTCEIQ